MVPVVSVYAGYAAWFAGYLTAHRTIGRVRRNVELMHEELERFDR